MKKPTLRNSLTFGASQPFPSKNRSVRSALYEKNKRKGANNLLSNDYVFEAQSFNFVTIENL